MAKWTVDNYNGSTPKWILNSAGKFAVGETAECCCGAGCSCVYCTTCGSTTITLTLSGITACDRCAAGAPYSIALSIPGTVGLVRQSDPCLWQANAGSVTMTRFAGNSCTGGTIGQTSPALTWRLTKTDGAWNLYAKALEAIYGPFIVFFDTIATNNCAGNHVWTNDYGAPNCGDFIPAPYGSVVVGYGGTATK